VKALMMPLPPESIFYTIQSGFPTDGICLAAVGAMNGLKNQNASMGGVSPADPDFVRAIELLRKIQLSGAVGMRIRQDPQKPPTSILSFRSKDITEETLANVRGFRRLMRLDQDAQEFQLIYGATSSSGTEVAMQTRSLLQIKGVFAAHAEIPAEDIAQGRATAGFETAEGEGARLSLARIHSSKSRPGETFVAVPYHGHWFWIADNDLKTKRVFAFMMLLFTLADTGEKENLPLITIPAQ
jgi:hypothetical protein